MRINLSPEEYRFLLKYARRNDTRGARIWLERRYGVKLPEIAKISVNRRGEVEIVFTRMIPFLRNREKTVRKGLEREK